MWGVVWLVAVANLGWYVLASLGWMRYAFVGLMLSAPAGRAAVARPVASLWQAHARRRPRAASLTVAVAVWLAVVVAPAPAREPAPSSSVCRPPMPSKLPRGSRPTWRTILSSRPMSRSWVCSPTTATTTRRRRCSFTPLRTSPAGRRRRRRGTTSGTPATADYVVVGPFARYVGLYGDARPGRRLQPGPRTGPVRGMETRPLGPTLDDSGAPHDR